ncbi:MAG: hypothetical protein E6K52_01445 [Gammaproteobacteria bacterium]|nr:MAG: hypothetical protein E6K52_01445 [Gammaproteobacteria bacterium]
MTPVSASSIPASTSATSASRRVAPIWRAASIRPTGRPGCRAAGGNLTMTSRRAVCRSCACSSPVSWRRTRACVRRGSSA